MDSIQTFDLVGCTLVYRGNAMTKKKGPQMTHTAEDELLREIDSIIDDASENAEEEEMSKREKGANQVVDDVRERAARRERA